MRCWDRRAPTNNENRNDRLVVAPDDTALSILEKFTMETVFVSLLRPTSTVTETHADPKITVVSTRFFSSSLCDSVGKRRFWY